MRLRLRKVNLLVVLQLVERWARPQAQVYLTLETTLMTTVSFISLLSSFQQKKKKWLNTFQMSGMVLQVRITSMKQMQFYPWLPGCSVTLIFVKEEKICNLTAKRPSSQSPGAPSFRHLFIHSTEIIHYGGWNK